MADQSQTLAPQFIDLHHSTNFWDVFNSMVTL